MESSTLQHCSFIQKNIVFSDGQKEHDLCPSEVHSLVRETKKYSICIFMFIIYIRYYIYFYNYICDYMNKNHCHGSV